MKKTEIVEERNKLLLIRKQFIFVLIIIISFIIYYFCLYTDMSKREKMAQTLLTSYNMMMLYNNSSYIATKATNTEETGVIGVIEIPKINVKYPIFNKTTEELLKTAPCKFYGADPNEIGNFCIIGHNYENEMFFSKLTQLQQGDEVQVSDLTDKKVMYYVYKTYEVSADNVSCIYPITENKREITLITCNNNNGKRIIVKAIE